MKNRNQLLISKRSQLLNLFVETTHKTVISGRVDRSYMEREQSIDKRIIKSYNKEV